MQSLMHVHLPANIVLHCVQVTDKTPIVVSETDANTLSHTHVVREIRPCFRCLHAQARLAFHSPQTTCQKAFTGQYPLFVFCSALACPLYRYVGH